MQATTDADRRPFLRPRRGRWLALALLLALIALTAPAAAQVAPPWEGWYLPPADGLLKLRFGMDPATVDSILTERGLEPYAAAEESQLRHDGKILGRPANVLTRFADARGAMREGRLARIELRWRWEGTLRAPERIFEQLVGLMSERYGDPIRVQEPKRADLEVGTGHGWQAFQGPEAQVLVEIQAVRPELYRVGLRMDFPRWARGF